MFVICMSFPLAAGRAAGPAAPLTKSLVHHHRLKTTIKKLQAHADILVCLVYAQEEQLDLLCRVLTAGLEEAGVEVMRDDDGEALEEVGVWRCSFGVVLGFWCGVCVVYDVWRCMWCCMEKCNRSVRDGL